MSRQGKQPSATAGRNKPSASVGVGKNKRTVGEVAGRATAECTAVACCVPLAAADAVALALYKAPAGMCKKVIEKKKKKEKEELVVKQRRAIQDGRRKGKEKLEESAAAMLAEQPTAEEAALNLEMHDKFQGLGFWRSSSQRSDKQGSKNKSDSQNSNKLRLGGN